MTVPNSFVVICPDEDQSRLLLLVFFLRSRRCSRTKQLSTYGFTLTIPIFVLCATEVSR